MIMFLKRNARKALAVLYVAILSGLCTPVSAQRIALKTNFLYWAAASPNIGLEVRVNRHMTFDFDATYNNVAIGKFDSRVLMFTPEMRYWFSGRPQAAHFVGITGLAANYDIRVKRQRHDGDAFGGGLTYGYSFVLNKNWSLEMTLGGGLIYRHEADYDVDKENHPTCSNVRKFQLAPLKAGISFIYIIK